MRRQQAGFSLIEMLVAMVILSMTLGTLYHAVTGATRNIRIDQDYNHAAIIAESVLENYRLLPAGGVQDSGEFERFAWSVESLGVVGDEHLVGGERLHWIKVVVDWDEPGGRQVVLNSVAPESGSE